MEYIKKVLVTKKNFFSIRFQTYLHNACKYGATQEAMKTVEKHRGLTSKVGSCQAVQASSLQELP